MIREPYNLLPLETWRRILGWNPWHFWGLTASHGAPALTSDCLDIITEYAWQDTQSCGREEIRNAIIQAEVISREWSGYWPAPKYGECEVPYPRRGSAYQRQYNFQPNGRQIGIELNESKLLVLGVEQRVAIDETAEVIYSDADNDDIDDTFTLTVTVVDGTLPDQIAVYFIQSDRVDEADISERWRVQPVIVKVSGTTATIKGRRWLVVKPTVYEGMTGEGINAELPDNFVTELAVYMRITNPNGNTLDDAQSVIYWENRPCHGWWCCCSNCSINPAITPDPAATASAIARSGIRYPEPGIIYATQAVYNSSTGMFVPGFNWWEPDRVKVRWLAGVPLQSQQMMDTGWATVISRLTAAELARPICACDNANKELYRWQFDLATSTSEAEQYQLDQNYLGNPIGTRRGHVEAWKWITRHEVTTGFLPG